MNNREDQPKIHCPICAKPVEQSIETFPFCSKRCRLIDLGQWLGGGYRISRPIEWDDDIDDAES
jgi:hypothetical protein